MSFSLCEHHLYKFLIVSFSVFDPWMFLFSRTLRLRLFSFVGAFLHLSLSSQFVCPCVFVCLSACWALTVISKASFGREQHCGKISTPSSAPFRCCRRKTTKETPLAHRHPLHLLLLHRPQQQPPRRWTLSPRLWQIARAKWHRPQQAVVARRVRIRMRALELRKAVASRALVTRTWTETLTQTTVSLR